MPVFVDTHILLYALDPRDSRKQLLAQKALSRCWQERSGRVSLQILNELYVKLIRLAGAAGGVRARVEVRKPIDSQGWIGIRVALYQ